MKVIWMNMIQFMFLSKLDLYLEIFEDRSHIR